VDTEIETHLRGEKAIGRQTQGVEKLKANDVADAIAYMVTRDRRVAVNEMLVRAGAQTW
jgi:NADP-dependent 3-hydroxy acid dehydrogenase YdfG